MRDSLRLGRIAGIPVAVHWSVLLVVLLLAWSLADGVLPQTVPGRSTAAYWAHGVVGALLLLCSLLAHELSHAVVARRFGVEVDGITLWMFGGVASLRGESPSSRADFRIAAVGPATSMVLAVGFGAAAVVGSALDLPDLVLAVTVWLAGINVMLALFNLIPGAPLDGGRMLRASLWRRWGDRERAAAAATRAGQMVGSCLVWLGLLSFLLGDYVGGLWMMLIGWFLRTAALAEQSAAVTAHTLEGVSVGAMMTTDVQTGRSDLTVEEFVNRLVLGGRHSAYPVVGPDGAVVGLVTLGQLRGVPAGSRATTRVAEVALPLAEVTTCTPDDPVIDVLPRLSRDSGNRALVFDSGRLVGIVTATDVTRVLETRSLLRHGRG